MGWRMFLKVGHNVTQTAQSRVPDEGLRLDDSIAQTTDAAKPGVGG